MPVPGPAGPLLRRPVAWLADRLGGPARARVIAVLASVLALDGADKGAVSVVASDLRADFGIDNVELGLLVAASTLSAAVVTIPVGVLTDRVRRTHLLGLSVLAGLAVLPALRFYPRDVATANRSVENTLRDRRAPGSGLTRGAVEDRPDTSAPRGRP